MRDLNVVSLITTENVRPYVGQLEQHLRLHLIRENDVFLLFYGKWQGALRAAYARGGWHPNGTDAKEEVSWLQVNGGGTPYGTLFSGHYFPKGQLVSSGDARALAEGLRNALAYRNRTTRNEDDGKATVHDPRILNPGEHAGRSADYWSDILDQQWLEYQVPEFVENMASFLEGGAFRIENEWPAEIDPFHGGKTKAEAEAEDEILPKLGQLYEQKRRLVQAISRGVVSVEEAEPEMEEIRQEITALQKLIPSAG